MWDSILLVKLKMFRVLPFTGSSVTLCSKVLLSSKNYFLTHRGCPGKPFKVLQGEDEVKHTDQSQENKNQKDFIQLLSFKTKFNSCICVYTDSTQNISHSTDHISSFLLSFTPFIHHSFFLSNVFPSFLSCFLFLSLLPSTHLFIYLINPFIHTDSMLGNGYTAIDKGGI